MTKENIEVLEAIEVELLRETIEEQRETIKGLIEILKNIRIPIQYYYPTQPSVNPGANQPWLVYSAPYTGDLPRGGITSCQEGSWGGSTVELVSGSSVHDTFRGDLIGGSQDQM